MKKILAFFLMALMLISYMQTSVAGEFTGVGSVLDKSLAEKGMSLDSLIKSGHTVMMGEFTGVGRTLPIKSITYMVAGGKVIDSMDVLEVKLSRPTGKTLADVLSIETEQGTFTVDEIETVIFKN